MGWFSFVEDFIDDVQENILQPIVEAAPEFLAKAGLGYGFTTGFFGGEKYIQVPDGDGGMTWLRDTGFDYSGTDNIVAPPDIVTSSATSDAAISWSAGDAIDANVVYNPPAALSGPVIDIPTITEKPVFDPNTFGNSVDEAITIPSNYNYPGTGFSLPNVSLKDVISAGSAIANASLAANTAQAQIDSQRAITSAQIGALNRQSSALQNALPVIGANGKTAYLPGPTYDTLRNPLPSPMGDFGPLLPDQRQTGVITPSNDGAMLGVGAIVFIVIIVVLFARK